MKVALVHDWMIHMRGGEKVLEALAEIYPEAVIYTLFYDKKSLSPVLAEREIKASFLQAVPGVRFFYRALLPLLPAIAGTLRVEDADVVISSSHCVAKGIRVPTGAVHLCYCHTPMRYAWGFEDDYLRPVPRILRPLVRRMLERLRRWDACSSRAVHRFVANSANVRGRIREFYERDAEVIYPPVDPLFFEPAGPLGLREKDYYLVVSAFVPYKRVDLVIEAFNRLERRLIIVGKGPLEKAYRRLRRTDRISFLSGLSGDRLRELYGGARALVFATDEDFGIVPVEAQACGTPVIAFAKGGALESVKSGVFFREQTPEAVARAVLDFEKLRFDPREVRSAVRAFEKKRFQNEIIDFVAKSVTSEPHPLAR